MFATVATISLTLGLLGLSSAIPTSVDLAPRCGTILVPTILQQLSEASPSTVGANTITSNGDFHVSQTVGPQGNVHKRIYQIAAFQNIPAGSYGCQLAFTFPATSKITSTGVPTLNVTTFANGESAQIVYPNNFAWSTLYPPTSPPFGVGLFGTVTLAPGTTQVINSEGCPVGGGNLAFLFSIADWETQSASVEFKEHLSGIHGGPGLAGVYLTYNC